VPTLIGFRCIDGAAIAADRTVAVGGSVRSRDRRRVYGFDGPAVAIGGDDVDAVRDRLAVAVDEYAAERDVPPGVEAFARIASRVAGSFDAELAILARDRDGTARVRAVYGDGSVLGDLPIALGSGAELAIGRLEAASGEVSVAGAGGFAADVLAGVAERDPATGGETDVATLADE